jgi:exopolysaccharide biosynthesis protein PssK
MTETVTQTQCAADQIGSTFGAVMSSLLNPGEHCALIDFPAHANVGDSAIWSGERAWLAKRGVEVTYACDTETYRRDVLARHTSDRTTILIHGGGNLGDLWEDHHTLREAVIADFPDKRIVQLPQSIHFRDPLRLARARDVFNAHKDLTILCRDEHSLALAEANFRAQSRLCPDAAFALGHIPRPQPAQTRVVWLSRSDREAVGRQAVAIPPGIEKTDWLIDTQTQVIDRGKRLRENLIRNPDADTLLEQLLPVYDDLAAERLFRGARMLSRGQAVITDRLHAHILCELIGIPHVVLDNSYGKVRRFYDAWTRESKLARWATSIVDAFEMLEDIPPPPIIVDGPGVP